MFRCGCRRWRLRCRRRLPPLGRRPVRGDPGSGNCRLLFARNRSRWRFPPLGRRLVRGDPRLDGGSRRWRNHNHRARNCNRACRGLGHDRARRRTAGNSRSRCGLGNNRRGLPRLRNNLARLRACRSCGGERGRGGRGPLRGLGWLRRRGGRLCRHAHVMRLFFLFLLLGQNGLHHIAGLGDVRQVDFGNDGGRAVTVRRTCGMRSRSRFLRKMRTNPIRLVAFERTGVRFARRNTELRKNVENRARLYFQFFREIVDTNLAHPPLFNSVPPNRP